MGHLEVKRAIDNAEIRHTRIAMTSRALARFALVCILAVWFERSTAAQRQACRIDAPEASDSGSFATTGLAQHAMHYYDEGVPINTTDQPPLLIHSSVGAILMRDAISLERRVAIPLSGPVVSALAERLDGASVSALFVTQTDGYVNRWDVPGGPVNWSRNVGRSACSDSVADVVIHPTSFSTDDFRAIHGNLAYVGTRYNSRCSGYNSDNKVFALDARTGQIVWTFNEYESLAVDSVSGLAVDNVLGDLDVKIPGVKRLQRDQFQDQVFVTTDRTFESSQSSVWAINVLFGTHRWSVNAGRIHTNPVVRDDRLYVANLTGELKALDKITGSELWSIHRGLPFVRDFVVGRRAPYDNLIALTDYVGDVVLARDNGTSAEWMWTTSLDSAGTVRVSTSPVIDDVNGYVYVGATDGQLYQLNIANGTLRGTRTVDSAGQPVVDLMRQSPEIRDRLAYSLVAADENTAIARYCTPFGIRGSTNRDGQP